MEKEEDALLKSVDTLGAARSTVFPLMGYFLYTIYTTRHEGVCKSNIPQGAQGVRQIHTAVHNVGAICVVLLP